MKILITGANGLVGQHLVKRLLEKNYDIVATGRGSCRLPFSDKKNFSYVSLDITDGTAVNDCLLKVKPQVIVHAAAITQIDECETDKQTCWNTNVTATRFLLDGAKQINARFIYISSDFVFDGKYGPYKEDDITAPVNYYGSTKVAAEKAVIESGLDSAIVRTVLVYGNTFSGTRNNIISWVRQSLEEDKTIKVVADQWRTPTYVDDLVEGIVLILEKNARGIYHLSGKDFLTPYDMAIKTATFFGFNKDKIEKTDASSFQQKGVRPAKTGFHIDKATQELGYSPLSFDEGLKKMFT